MNKDVAGLIAIRPGEPDDRNFILGSWIQGAYHDPGMSWLKEAISITKFTEAYQKMIFKVLNYPHTEVRVAGLKDEPSVILGYSVFTNNLLHWVFVKKSWRKVGIGRDLIPENIDICTSMSAVGRSLKPKTMQYDSIFYYLNDIKGDKHVRSY